MSAPVADRYDPFAPEVLEDPYPSYAWLRSEAPVYHVEEHDIWVLSRYEDILQAVRRPEVFSSNQGVSFERRPVPMLVAIDPPDHTRLRRLVSRHFTPRAVEAGWRERIATIADDLLDRAFAEGEVDLHEAVSEPLPVTVIAEMMGVPVERQADFRRWSDATIDTTGGVLSEENELTILEFAMYCQELVDERRAHPERNQGDLISVLFGETVDGDRLADDELVAFLVLLLVAGNETTTNLISNTVNDLLERPEVWAQVAADPRLVPSLTEEAVRWVSPVQGLFRNTLSEVTVAGTTIPADAKVLMLYGSGNRDTARWADADRFRLDRYPEGHVGSDHLGFGHGIHLCLGAHVARLEAMILFEKLAQRLGAIERTGPTVRGVNPAIRAVKSLPVRLTPR
ncbi:MAG: cytochrome P450 [Acidimicrobiales bacterium]|jgi:cytochrome P450|nr:cytochrome P450 [Acidimicrobiales bacterium]